MNSDNKLFYFNNNGKFIKNEDSGNWSFTKSIKKQISGLIKGCELDDNGRLLIQSGDTLYLTDIEGRNWQRIFANGFFGSGKIYLENFNITKNGCLFSTASYEEIMIDTYWQISRFDCYRYINFFENSIGHPICKRCYVDSDIPKRFYVLPNGNRYLLNRNSLYECNNNENIWSIVERLPVKNDNISDFNNDNLNNLYLLDKIGYLYKSSDNGISWRKSNAKNPHLVGSVELKSFSTNELVAYSGVTIYQSSDCGESWINISSGLSGSIAKLFKSNKNEYYAVTSEGVYKSNNIPFYDVSSRPTLVKPKNDEFIGAAIESVRLVWNKTDKTDSYEIMTGNKNFDKIYRYYKGITDTTKAIPASGDTVYWKVRALNGEVPGEWSDAWRYIFHGTVGIESKNDFPKEFHLFQNYPNPFNPNTTISYSIPKKSFVKITVYDINGKEIETLANKIEESGLHMINWNPKLSAGGISSGVYYYKLSISNKALYKKMIYVR